VNQFPSKERPRRTLIRIEFSLTVSRLLPRKFSHTIHLLHISACTTAVNETYAVVLESSPELNNHFPEINE